MTTTAAISNFVDVKGVTPIVHMTNWNNKRVTLTIKIGEVAITSFIEPLTEEPVVDYIQRIVEALGDIEIKFDSQN